MKHIYLSALLLAGAFSMSAQSKLNPAGLVMLNDWNQAKIEAIKSGKVQTLSDDNGPVVKVIVTLENNANIEDILTPGMVLDAVLPSGNAIVDLPIGLVDKLAANDDVKFLSFGNTCEPALDKARASGNVDQVQNGTDGLNRAYTGKGVLCGIYDTGIDPTHITFTNGGSRVLRFNNGAKLYTPENMSEAVPATNEETHGTHCAGILAGNGAPKRPGTYTDGTTTGIWNAGYCDGSTFRPLENPYQGVAKDAYLYMVDGQAYDTSILSGVNQMVNFGKSEGLPTVISLSWGSNVGPHDGSREICRELDAMSKDAIIVIAAGNEGAYNLSCKKTFTASDNTLKTFLTGSSNAVTSLAEFWASNNSPLKLSIGVYDLTAKQIVKTQNVTVGNSTVTVNCGTLSADAFSSGTIKVTGGIDGRNNRAYISISSDYVLKDRARYLPFFTVTGNAGQTVMGICNKVTAFSSQGVAGFTDGTPDESISDMACGKNVIVVGAYTSRTDFSTLPFKKVRKFSTYETLDDISSFSSYGTAFNGRNLPDICAPGSVLISSISSGYTKAKGYKPYSDNMASAYYTSTNGKTYYFENMQGTSMATPFVAGVVALWLEANPNLTVDDVRALLKKTSIRDQYVTSGNPIRWGDGKIDALAGIKEILAAGVDDIDMDLTNRLIVERSGSDISISLPGADNLSVRLISLSGATVFADRANDSSINISAGSFNPGVYVIEASDSRGVYTSKILL